MTIQKTLNVSIAGFVTILAVSFLFLTISVSAHETGEIHDETEVAQTVTEPESMTTDMFNYVAQSGDSYSLMARKAVQTFGIESSTNLSGAQIIFVETNLTQIAKSPQLNLGEKVSISRDLVKEWSEKAKSLTEMQQKEWDVYASNANFNTNAVGEVRE